MDTRKGTQEETHTSIQEDAHSPSLPFQRHGLREAPANELTATKTGTSRNSLYIPLGHIPGCHCGAWAVPISDLALGHGNHTMAVLRALQSPKLVLVPAWAGRDDPQALF